VRVKLSNVTDAGLAHLEGLTQLSSPNVDRTQITDVELVRLKALGQEQSVSASWPVGIGTMSISVVD
jgi:hypothetical protein